MAEDVKHKANTSGKPKRFLNELESKFHHKKGGKQLVENYNKEQIEKDRQIKKHEIIVDIQKQLEPHHGQKFTRNDYKVTKKQKKICVASHSDRYMNLVANQLRELIFDHRLQIFGKKLSNTAHDFYEGAGAVVLVATASQRLLIISDKEESQIGKAYRQALQEKMSPEDIFIMLVAHKESENLTAHQAYSADLQQAFEGQLKVKEALEDDRFISMSYIYNPEDLDFNYSQECAITEWINYVFNK